MLRKKKKAINQRKGLKTLQWTPTLSTLRQNSECGIVNVSTTADCHQLFSFCAWPEQKICFRYAVVPSWCLRSLITHCLYSFHTEAKSHDPYKLVLRPRSTLNCVWERNVEVFSFPLKNRRLLKNIPYNFSLQSGNMHDMSLARSHLQHLPLRNLFAPLPLSLAHVSDPHEPAYYYVRELGRYFMYLSYSCLTYSDIGMLIGKGT